MNRFWLSLLVAFAGVAPLEAGAAGIWCDAGNGRMVTCPPQRRQPTPPPQPPVYDGYETVPGQGGAFRDGPPPECTPEQAVRLARRYGLSDARLASEGTKTLFIDGYDYNADKSVRLVISKSPGCPLVDRL